MKNVFFLTIILVYLGNFSYDRPFVCYSPGENTICNIAQITYNVYYSNHNKGRVRNITDNNKKGNKNFDKYPDIRISELQITGAN